MKGKQTIINILLDIFSPPLTMPGPINDTSTTFTIGSILSRATHDLDPQKPVREITIVKSKPEISIGS
jgi:hypothetical protein